MFVKELIARLESRCFDALRGIETSEFVSVKGLTLAGSGEGAFDYLPSRARTAQIIFSRLPISGLSDYTFIDLGSGKGRILFLAAERPFRSVVGVEVALELHQKAQENIARYRGRKRRCGNIASLHANAADYCFPDENLVIYLFNPFAPEVMRKVLDHLDQSFTRHPRDIFLALAWPELAEVIRQDPVWQAIEETPRYCLYRAVQR